MRCMNCENEDYKIITIEAWKEYNGSKYLTNEAIKVCTLCGCQQFLDGFNYEEDF